MHRAISISLLLLVFAVSCQRGKAETPPPPNASRKPAGEGWWCVKTPDVRMSCQRTQEGCETDRGRMRGARPDVEVAPCEPVATASCLTFKPRGSGNEAPFCLPTAALCEETRQQLLSAAADKGHTLITGCATWK